LGSPTLVQTNIKVPHFLISWLNVETGYIWTKMHVRETKLQRRRLCLRL